MNYYHNALICENGHILSPTIDLKTNFDSPFCTECGARTISKCPHCESEIRGVSYDSLDFYYSLPSYCHNCGKPYPWTESALKVAALLIQEDENLDNEQKQTLQDCLPDLITETPSTNLAVVRLKKALKKVGKFTGEGLLQFVNDFCCQLALKLLGL